MEGDVLDSSRLRVMSSLEHPHLAEERDQLRYQVSDLEEKVKQERRQKEELMILLEETERKMNLTLVAETE